MKNRQKPVTRKGNITMAQARRMVRAYLVKQRSA